MEKFFFLTTLCLSLATGAAFAQSFGGGRGTESDPVRISSRAHLEELATSVNGGATYEGYHFKLTADLSGITTVIGNAQAFFFSGIFDGDGHTIELNINSTGDRAGIFGHLSGATVKNTNASGKVVLVPSSSSDYSYAGGICGYANNSTVSNCYNMGSISATANYRNSYAGGICGIAMSSTVGNCHNTGSISATSLHNDSNAGGICGGANSQTFISGGIISNCYNTGNISAAGSSSNAGGICGIGGTVSNCYNMGSISATASYYSNAGGICGGGGSGTGTISNCYNMGSIFADSSYSYAGGICGYGGTISNCYNAGSISAAASGSYSYHSYAGGICGYDNDSRIIISNCFAANATITASIGSNYAGRIGGYGGGRISNCHALISMKLNGLERRSMNADSKDGADGVDADFKNESWLASSLEWDFKTVWTIGRNGWPALKSVDGPTGNGSPERALPEVVLYPNPATHDVYIRTDRPVSKVEIYNSAGLCVWRTDRFTDKADISGLESGVYAVRIYTTPEPQTKLLVIRK